MFSPDAEGKLQFFVQWFDDEGNARDSEIILNHSKSGAIVQIARRFVNRTEPDYACGFHLRGRLLTDVPTLLGTIQSRKGKV